MSRRELEDERVWVGTSTDKWAAEPVETAHALEYHTKVERGSPKEVRPVVTIHYAAVDSDPGRSLLQSAAHWSGDAHYEALCESTKMSSGVSGDRTIYLWVEDEDGNTVSRREHEFEAWETRCAEADEVKATLEYTVSKKFVRLL